MKVNIGPYKNWVGPYQIAEKLLFWMDKDKDHRVHEFGTWLHDKKDGEPTILARLCTWIDSKKKRKVKVKIDNYDIWNMCDTVAIIVLPMLKKMQEDKHGTPFTDDEDVPEGLGLRSTEASPKENEYDTDDNFQKRWDWILGEMVWAFEQLQPDYDWEEQYRSGEMDIVWVPTKLDADGKPELYQMTDGPKNTYKCDYDGMKVHQDRIQRGTKLFGIYLQTLWT
jgi:hypothetical protein